MNYEVCHYCRHLMREASRDDYLEGCGLVKNSQRKYARITLGDEVTALKKKYGIDSVNSLKGCDRFKASGLPAHPQALEVLVRSNPKCSAITSDPKAIETSYDFSRKINQYLPKRNIIFSDKIQ